MIPTSYKEFFIKDLKRQFKKMIIKDGKYFVLERPIYLEEPIYIERQCVFKSEHFFAPKSIFRLKKIFRP